AVFSDSRRSRSRWARKESAKGTGDSMAPKLRWCGMTGDLHLRRSFAPKRPNPGTRTYPCPMLRSMTGYGRAESSDDVHAISVEIKSVNNRYLDFQCRGPRELLNLDNILRKELGDFVMRGSVTCNVNVETKTAANEASGIALN